MSEALQRRNAVLTDALQAILEMSAGPQAAPKSFDLSSIHETAADALADIDGGASAVRAAGDVLFRGVRDHFVTRGTIDAEDYPHRPGIEVQLAGMVLLTLDLARDQDIDLGGAMAEIIATNNRAA